MRHPFIPFLLCLSFAAGIGMAQAQEGTLAPNGAFQLRVGNVPVITGDSVLLMDEKWQGIDTPTNAAAKIERQGDRVTARYQSPITTLVKSVTSKPGETEIRWEMQMKPDARGRWVELCLSIPPAVLADFPAGKTQDALRSAEEIRVSSFLGDLVFDVRGSSAPWSLDDMRAVAWAKMFRLRFAPAYDPAKGLTATAVLRVRCEERPHPAFTCLDVSAAGNRALRDEKAGDGQGGWTDQGDNDLRVFTPGRHRLLGVPFQVGERAIILRGKEQPALPLESGVIPVNARLARLYFLHTTAWSGAFRQPVAEYEITYADGKSVPAPVRYGLDVNDWWGASEPLEARLAWSGDNGHATVGLSAMRWENPRPETEIRSLRVRSLNTEAIPILLAVTGAPAGALTAEQVALLDTAFNERAEPPVDTKDWIPAPIAWRDGITPGSALDISFLNDAPAGKNGFLQVRGGHFVFAKGDGKPVRFWGTNAAITGPFPQKEDAPGIAACLARQGVNMVRLHLYAALSDGLLDPKGGLNPDALDRMEYFIAQLKARGIYSYMDLNDGMFYDRLMDKKLPVEGNKLKLASLFDRDLIDAQKKLARLLFTHVNPYTRLRLCDDPAVALYEITNENSLTMGWGSLKERLPEPYYSELQGLWRAWLKGQGQAERDLPDTLGDAGSSALSRRFGAVMQRRYLEEMRDYLRGLGVRAPICGTNITFTLGDLWASQGMDYTNDHNYWDHPNVSARPMTYGNRAALSAAAWSLPMLPAFARAKMPGKPVVASEWNYCFPNDYRCEGLPMMAAYSAYQDWDGLLFYCATGSFDAGVWTRFHDAPGILVHSQQTDPATWGLSQACALLYRRGDVRVSGRTVRLRYGGDSIWENQSVLGKAQFLPALTRVETEITEKQGEGWKLPEMAADASPADLYKATLQALGNSRSSTQGTVSDTGEIRRETTVGTLVVDTPRTQIAEGFLARAGDVALTNLTVSCETRFATLALTSLDGQPIARSKRMLLTAVANARNADQKCTGRLLESMGKGPVLAEPVRARLSLRGGSFAGMRVYALDPLTGKRGATVPVEMQGKELAFRIGAEQRTIYYELSR